MAPPASIGQVYGSTPERAAALRTGSSGRLATDDADPGMLPRNTLLFPNEDGAHTFPGPADEFFLAGGAPSPALFFL
jgi:hypothetical protein